MAKKPSNTEIDRNAYLICLLAPVNTTMYDLTLQIEALLDILPKAKNTEEFGKGHAILVDFAKKQQTLATHLNELVESIVATPTDQTKTPADKPKVH